MTPTERPPVPSAVDLEHPRSMAYRERAWCALIALRDYCRRAPEDESAADNYRAVLRAVASLTEPIKPVVSIRSPEPPPSPRTAKGIA